MAEKRKAARAAFAAVLAASLGFGVTQAFASDAAAEKGAWCSDSYCLNVECAPFWGYCDEWKGICYCAG